VEAAVSDDAKGGPRIKVMKDGPYLVRGGVPLDEERIARGPDGEPCRWEKGESHPAKESYSLCRCGASKAKPFCDGSHFEAGFDGTETAERETDMSRAEKTVGPGLDLIFSPDLCVEARFCHAGKGAWSYAECSENPEDRAKAVQEACDCPSGALVAWDKETGRAIEPRLEPEIGAVEDPGSGLSGPLWVKSGIPIESAEGFEYERRNRVTLCRCGLSARKPFCDGAHIAAGFKAKP
jgi:CDGSH-type Zn-finger protein